MLRPKRAASQKAKQQEEEEKDSEYELDLSEESSGDFSSASSDEWDPTKKKVEETMEESEGSESEEEDESESFPDSPIKPRKSKGNMSVLCSLRGKTGNKFKRNLANRSNNLQEILQRAQYQKKKSIFDDSQTESKEKTPDFDCSGGLRLSCSSESDEDRPTTSAKAIANENKNKSSKPISTIEQPSGSTMVDLKAIHDNLQQMESAKAKLINYRSKKIPLGSQKEDVNIADLLAIGEGADEVPSTTHKNSSQKRARNTQVDESDSDNGWEEVEDEESGSRRAPHEDVEIMLNDMDHQERKKKDAKQVDLEAQMKRKLNRRRKEYQQCLHKVNLMLWIAHGNFVNQNLNNTELMARALELLPKNKNQCYPKDKTDVDYFQQITNWFRTTMKLRNKEMYTELKQRPPLMMSLALQMKFKAAICVRDYVLIFTILLRAIGIQCRMTQSLVCAPIFPPKSELLSLSTKKQGESMNKKENPKSTSKHNKSNISRSSKTKESLTKSGLQTKSQSKPAKKEPSPHSSRNSRSKNKKESKQPVIPQLDGGDDQPTDKKQKKLKIKAMKGYNVDESYVDINKDENLNPEPKRSKPVVLKSPRRTRSKSRVANPEVITLTPKVRFSLESPNQSPKQSSQKLFKPESTKAKQTKNGVKKVQEVFSPRKTRKTANNNEKMKIETNQTNSKKVSGNATKNNKEQKKNVNEKDTLQVFSPRRLRSRSRSKDDNTDDGSANKPNLKKLQNPGFSGNVRNKDAVAPLADKPNLEKLQSNLNRKRVSAPKSEVQAKKRKLVSESANKRAAVDENGTTAKKKAKPSTKDDSDYEGDTDESEKLFKQKSKPKSSKISKSSVIDRRVLSSDSGDETGVSKSIESPSKKSKGIDIWVEVYSEKDKRWIPIDVLKGKVDSVKDIVKIATHPMVYVFGWNNDKSIKDVSARYCPNLNTTVRKMRVESKYLNSIIVQFEGIKTARDVKEDEELNMLQVQKPMPTSIAEFKNHPLYVLKRHLLKYQAIYPPEPPILGEIRNESIYPRDCVFLLHTRETWLKEARVVKMHEEPYKITKTMKWDNVRRKLIKDVPQELFGIWQTKDYEPPVAENGIVPRNAYGNVELFKPSMLPIGTVHLQLPGLNKVCKKTGVDCSQAIVGFDSNGGWPYPVYDGFIVCKEFEEKVIDAWNREQEDQERKENEKYEKRVYGNWKKLIKGLLIRQRLKNKYNFEGES